MTDKSSGKPAKGSNPGRIALIGGIGTVLAIINMSTNSEAPSSMVGLLQYIALGLGLLALIGGLIMMATAPKAGG